MKIANHFALGFRSECEAHSEAKFTVDEATRESERKQKSFWKFDKSAPLVKEPMQEPSTDVRADHPMDHRFGAASGRTRNDVTGDEYRGIPRKDPRERSERRALIKTVHFELLDDASQRGDGTSQLGQNEASAIALQIFSAYFHSERN